MNTIFYVLHMYVTRILLVTGLVYTFLTHGCPTCQGRIESNSPAFFAEEVIKNEAALPLLQPNAKNPNTEIEVTNVKEHHA